VEAAGIGPIQALGCWLNRCGRRMYRFVIDRRMLGAVSFREHLVERVEFLVEGSQGDRYALAFEVNGTHANAFCTCQAGANGLFCKHRVGVMDGEVSYLLSGNTADIVRLKDLLSGTDLETAYNRFLEAEATWTVAKKELDVAKKGLAKAMYRR